MINRKERRPHKLALGTVSTPSVTCGDSSLREGALGAVTFYPHIISHERGKVKCFTKQQVRIWAD